MQVFCVSFSCAHNKRGKITQDIPRDPLRTLSLFLTSYLAERRVCVCVCVCVCGERECGESVSVSVSVRSVCV